MYRKFIIILILVLSIFVFSNDLHAKTRVYLRSALTGGGIGAVDALDGNLPAPTKHSQPLADGDKALVITLEDNVDNPKISVEYVLDADCGLAETPESPGVVPTVITPDTNPGIKCWLKTDRPGEIILCDGVTLASGDILFYDISNTCWDVLPLGSDAQVIISDGTDLNYRALSGDVTVDNTGVVSLAADSVGTAEMADEDHGDFTYSGGVATINDGVVTDIKTADNLTISDGIINNTPIGDITPAPGSFTALGSGDAEITGDVAIDNPSSSDDAITTNQSPYGWVNNGEQQAWMDVLPLNRTWVTSNWVPPTVWGSSLTQSDIIKVADTYYMVREALIGSEWQIDLAYTTDPTSGGNWTVVTPFMVGNAEVVAYTSGGTTEITIGDTITGLTGGATGWVNNITLSSGTWAGGTAAGNIYIATKTGTFQAEGLSITGGGGTDVATVGGDSAATGYYDAGGRADAEIKYVPWSATPFHIWFDMFEVGPDFDTTVGHATCVSSCEDPNNWTEQDFDSANGPDAVIQSEEIAKFGAFNVDTRAHALEIFMCGGVTHALSQVRGTGHTQYDNMLYIASDPLGLGYEFVPYGPVTIDATTWENEADRLTTTFVHGSHVYGKLSDLAGADPTVPAWVVSSDCGKSWRQIGEPGNPYTSIIIEGNKLYGIGTGLSTFEELDLTNLTGTVDIADYVASCGYSNDPYETITNQCRNNPLQIVENVQKGYYINGNAVADSSNLYINNTSVMTSNKIQGGILYSDQLGSFGSGAIENRVSADLDGSTDAFEITDADQDGNLDIGTDDVVIEWWSKTTVGDTAMTIIGKSGAAGNENGQWHIRVQDGSGTMPVLVGRFADDDGDTCSFTMSGGQASDWNFAEGNWHHYLLVYDINNGAGSCTMDVYEDGIFIVELSDGTPIDSTNSNAFDFVIGGRGPTPDTFFDGSIANVRLYHAAGLQDIATSEALALYRYPHKIPSTLSSSLVGEWYLDEGQDIFIVDSSSSNNFLTVIGTPVWSGPRGTGSIAVDSISYNKKTIATMPKCNASREGLTGWIDFENAKCTCDGTNYIRESDGLTCTDS